MSAFSSNLDKLVADKPPPAGTPPKPSRYRRMWRRTVVAVAAVSILPLLTVTLLNYFLYKRSFMQEITQPLHRIAALTKRSVESFLEERMAASQYVLSRESLDDLYDQQQLDNVFRRMRSAFGGIVDIGIIDAEGVMRTYAGPYDLRGKRYDDQRWFHEVMLRDVYVSDVFLGHRKLPHFIIAVRREDAGGRTAIFRATIDTDVLTRQIRMARLRDISDVFIINNSGVLQTPSRVFGPPLSDFQPTVPPYTEGTEIVEGIRIGDNDYLMGYAYIEHSPFVFVLLADRGDLMTGWMTYQGESIGFLVFSIVAILVLIMAITSNWVNRIRLADQRREATLHNVEHTNKMASIGRLAAGVAHEINNPLAIINEKAGLIEDILKFGEDNPQNQKVAKQVRSILKSVNRCSEITHRLLGFARHMDLKNEPVAVDALLREVLGFLEGEASYRGIEVDIQVDDTLPTIHSDKGQLQQLFLNIINNAFDAMRDIEGRPRLQISIRSPSPQAVVVTIADNGCGISDENLERIFEPFYTTKKIKGTGLGLSICYGIVRKLRGEMTVDSKLGQGTTFTISLPTERPE